MERILIYGFKPYKKYKKNISEAVVKSIKLGRGFKVKKVILPVFFRKEILKEIRMFRPDIIVGLGQKGRGKLLEIERTARNVYKINNKLKKINSRGPDKYLLNLRFKKKLKGTRSDYYSADYLCNFSRYIIMDFIKRNKLKTKFTFIHIPKDYNPQKAVNIIQEIIQ